MSLIERTEIEINNAYYETHRNWDVEWNCWRQVIYRIETDGQRLVVSDERVIDENVSHVTSRPRPGYHALQEMREIEAKARRDDRRSDRKAKVEYYEALEDGGMF